MNGTVNDLAVSGAKPMALSLSLVLEEGLPAAELRAEVALHWHLPAILCHRVPVSQKCHDHF